MDIKYQEEGREKRIIFNYKTYKLVSYILVIILIGGLIIKYFSSQDFSIVFVSVMTVGFIFLTLFFVYPLKVEILKNNKLTIKNRTLFFIRSNYSFDKDDSYIYAEKSKGLFSLGDYRVYIKDKKNINSVRLGITFPPIGEGSGFIPQLLSKEEIDKISQYFGLKVIFKN